MSAIEPGVKAEESTVEPERPNSPDPWGVRRAENLLTSLQGVLSARIEVSPIGEVMAVHVLTSAGTSPKQMVRNVESALLAQLGLKVDHRKISVAQTAEIRPIEALERSEVRLQALRRSVVFKSLEVERSGSVSRNERSLRHAIAGCAGTHEGHLDCRKGVRLYGMPEAPLVFC